MTEKDFRDKIIEHMATTSTSIDNLAGWVSKISDKVDDLSTSGCAKGGENERRITRLEKSPARKSTINAAYVGGGVAGIIISISEALQFYLRWRRG